MAVGQKSVRKKNVLVKETWPEPAVPKGFLFDPWPCGAQLVRIAWTLRAPRIVLNPKVAPLLQTMQRCCLDATVLSIGSHDFHLGGAYETLSSIMLYNYFLHEVDVYAWMKISCFFWINMVFVLRHVASNYASKGPGSPSDEPPHLQVSDHLRVHGLQAWKDLHLGRSLGRGVVVQPTCFVGFHGSLLSFAVLCQHTKGSSFTDFIPSKLIQAWSSCNKPGVFEAWWGSALRLLLPSCILNKMLPY